MAYCSLSDVQGLTPLTTIGISSRPTAAQVGEYIDSCAAEIDSALSTRGISSPTATPSWFVRDLQALNAKGAAAMTLMAMFPAQAGPGSNAQGMSLWKSYQDRLSEFRKGIGIPDTVADDGLQSPRSFFLDSDAIGSDPGTDTYGDDVIGEPTFTRGQIF